jgi:tungstate transport system ATP-binding protein
MTGSAGADLMSSRGVTLTGTGLKKSFGKRTVLDVEHIEVRPSSTLAVVGPSGAGKSTLLALLGLLEKPDAGEVRLDGRVVDSRDRRTRMRFAAAFQSPYLFKGTIADNVAYGLKLRGVGSSERARRVSAVLQRVGLDGWEPRSALTLSGGEAHRVALARALVLDPEVLFLDEPLSSLDPLLKGRLANDFSRILHEGGVTTVYVTHDQNEATAIADDMAVMREGRIVASGCIDDVMGLPPDEWTAVFLGGRAPLGGVVVESAEGVCRIDVSGVELFGAGEFERGTRVLVGVRPEDVMLFEADVELPRSSARNHVDCVVESVQFWGVTSQASLVAGDVQISARVTRAAVRDLGLAPGVRVQAVFKATAVRIRRA